jgi:hypothetical protein
MECVLLPFRVDPSEVAVSPRHKYARFQEVLMWTSLLLLWSIPLVIVFVMLARTAEGKPAVTDEESRLIFGDRDDRQEMSVTTLMALKFALFATVFFGVGVLQGLVFVNLGAFWAAAIPLITSMAAMLLLSYWVRSGGHENRAHRDIAQSRPTASRIARMLLR